MFIEQQDEDKKDFALRMSDSMKNQVTALAIFTGRAKDRNGYSYSCYGVDLSFRYNTYHVLSQDAAELRREMATRDAREEGKWENMIRVACSMFDDGVSCSKYTGLRKEDIPVLSWKGRRRKSISPFLISLKQACNFMEVGYNSQRIQRSQAVTNKAL